MAFSKKRRIEKGFLRPTSASPSTLRKAFAVIGGVGIAVTLYLLLYLLRDSVRLMGSFFGEGNFLILTNTEIYVLNWFLSSISCVIGFAVFVQIITERPAPGERPRRSAILNDQRTNTWYFLHWFLGFCSCMASFYIVFPMYYDISFTEEYLHMLFLLPCVLFLSFWPNLFRKHGMKAFKWFASSLLAIILTSAGLANINIIRGKMNEYLNRSDVFSYYDINIPSSDHCEQFSLRKAMVDRVYIAQDKSNENQIKIIIPHYANDYREVTLDSLCGYFKYHYGSINYAFANVFFHIDSDVKLKDVFMVIDSLSKVGTYRLMYNTAPSDGIYPPEHPYYRNGGFIGFSQRPIHEFVEFLHSYAKTTETTHPPDVPKWRPLLFGPNHIYITVKPGHEFLLEGENIDEHTLRGVIANLISRYPRYVVVTEYDEEVSFQEYIKMKDIFNYTIDSLRNEYSLKHFGEEYPLNGYGEFRDSTRRMVPARLFEMRSWYKGFFADWANLDN